MDYEAQNPPSYYEYVVPFNLPYLNEPKSSNNLPVIFSNHNYPDPTDAPESTKREAINCMKKLEGWCSDQKGTALIDLVYTKKPNVIVEIGVWGGKSLVPMAIALKKIGRGKIYGIDPWDSFESTQWVMNEQNKQFWSNQNNHNYVFEMLKKRIVEFRLESQITLIRSTSEAAAPISGIDMIHIDGNHSEYTSFLDVTKWVPLMNSGGLIVMDDISWYENGKSTLNKAVEWLNQYCIPYRTYKDSSDWGVWIKP